MIYLDSNASTPVDPDVVRTVTLCMAEAYANPSSSHVPGRQANAMVQEARVRVAVLIGCSPDEVIFTSGGTESNNLAILGTALRRGSGHVITSSIEHPSVTNTVRKLQALGFTATYVGVDEQCRVSPAEVQDAIKDDTVLITIMHSNNETGTLQPVAEIGEIARARGVPFHTDAAQSAGKVVVRAYEADMLTIASHKFYGPKGVGALYVRQGHALQPVIVGAGHERGLRPGTENVPGISGLGRAAELALQHMMQRNAQIQILRALMLEGLIKEVPGACLNGHAGLTLPGTLNVMLPGTDSAALVAALGADVAVSSGSACHEGGASAPSSVLSAMGIRPEDALASLRISIGKDNTEDEVRAATGLIGSAARAYRPAP